MGAFLQVTAAASCDGGQCRWGGPDTHTRTRTHGHTKAHRGTQQYHRLPSTPSQSPDTGTAHTTAEAPTGAQHMRHCPK